MIIKTPEQIVGERFPKAGDGLRVSLVAAISEAMQAGYLQASAAEDERIVSAVAHGIHYIQLPTDVAFAGWWPTDQDHTDARALIEYLRSQGFRIGRVEWESPNPIALATDTPLPRTSDTAP